jgi:hypothetical protein
MADTISHAHLIFLRFVLGDESIAALSGAEDTTDVLAWTKGTEKPSEEQNDRLIFAYEQVTRLNEGEGIITALAWFTLADIGALIVNDQFQEVRELAYWQMMPDD